MTTTKEYGDFQTPDSLAKEIAVIVNSSLPKIDTIIEPTCGTGSFIKAFTETTTSAKKENASNSTQNWRRYTIY